jgi:glycosyltransferase involved in cell wall biosynthesis
LSPSKGFQLTIGLPVYNAMPFLPEAVESLLTQTVRDFEILAIVDGGTDGSLAYLESVRDPRLKILIQPNAGLTATLNRMLREVSTRWLVRQDADDVSYPTRLERLLEFIDRHPDAGMFYSRAEYYPRHRSVGCFRSTIGTPDELRQLVQSGYLLSICHPCVVLNVEKTLAIGGYRSNMLVEDADLWWRMALAHDICYIPEVLVGFRQNLASVSSRNLERQMLRVLYVQYLLLSHLEGYDPEPFDRIASQLEALFPRRDFRAKEYLRSLNMALSEKNYGKAGLALLSTMTTSPTYLLRRLRDEFLPSVITNGVDPKFYHQRMAQLWPEVSHELESRPLASLVAR